MLTRGRAARRLKTRQLLSDCANQVRDEDQRHHEQERVLVQAGAPVVDPRPPSGRPGRAWDPTSCLRSVALEPGVLELLAIRSSPSGGARRWRRCSRENCRNSDCQFSITAPLKSAETTSSATDDTARSTVIGALCIEVVLSGERLRCQRRQKQRKEEERESVLPREAAHASRRPTTTENVTPPTTNDTYTKNINRTGARSPRRRRVLLWTVRDADHTGADSAQRASEGPDAPGPSAQP